MKVITLAVVLALVFSANCWVFEGHEMKGDASKAVYDGIKQELLSIIPSLTNQTTAQALKADLEQTDKTKLALKEIDNGTVSQIFSKFGLKDPSCDKDGNGKVSGDELKCLGKLWKYYLPK
eukprot:TRINITY_DN17638_c0_g1_i1.p1 TRINITY_DN17638_c0_g1~~TRINITY_DN17638_c0_g1_i1.p1  ORF type:complete len:121 (+),score=17.07 TRINITY_DN17638_c0_g1_i1:11-373(+)